MVRHGRDAEQLDDVVDTPMCARRRVAVESAVCRVLIRLVVRRELGGGQGVQLLPRTAHQVLGSQRSGDVEPALLEGADNRVLWSLGVNTPSCGYGRLANPRLWRTVDLQSLRLRAQRPRIILFSFFW